MDPKKILQSYDYQFRESLIAQEPASPRDSANLLVYSRKTEKVSWTKFIKLANHLPSGTVLVFNKTKVIPARLIVKKETGGRVRLLYVGREGGFIKVLADRRLVVGSELEINKKLKLRVSKQKDRIYFLTPIFPITSIFKILKTYGQTPIPPYIKNSPLKESDLKEKYQTIFASEAGSVAAPTAALHFTKRLFRKLKSAGVSAKFITLHVNLGTFSPITTQNLETNRLHEEQYEIDQKTAQALNKAKKSGFPIIAVGTTTLRALESSVDKHSQLHKLSGTTDLFIREGYQFKFINGLITNFHVPKSSLLMLVSALIGRKKTLELYQRAIKKKFRFFSFGDGMLIT